MAWPAGPECLDSRTPQVRIEAIPIVHPAVAADIHGKTLPQVRGRRDLLSDRAKVLTGLAATRELGGGLLHDG